MDQLQFSQALCKRCKYKYNYWDEFTSQVCSINDIKMSRVLNKFISKGTVFKLFLFILNDLTICSVF